MNTRKPVFGVPLEEVLLIEYSESGVPEVPFPPPLPSLLMQMNYYNNYLLLLLLFLGLLKDQNKVIEKCISYLRNCYEVEGIFRKSGGAAYIDEMKKCFNRGEDVDLSTVDDPHAVSGLFKTFLRDLPDPLLTFDLYDAFIQTQRYSPLHPPPPPPLPSLQFFFLFNSGEIIFLILIKKKLKFINYNINANKNRGDGGRGCDDVGSDYSQTVVNSSSY